MSRIQASASNGVDTTLPLLHSTKRLLALPNLPPYATDLVRSIVREVRERDALVNSILASHAASQGGESQGFDPAQDPATACRLLVEHLSMRRGKRALLAYHRARTGKIEERIWEGREEEFEARGGDASQNNRNGDGGANHEAESNLSPEEEDYVRQYAELLAAMKGKWTDVDLTGSLEPPGDLFVDVRCIKDAGEVQTEYG